MRKILALTVGMLTMLAALAACGGGGSSKNDSSSSGGGKDDAFTALYDKAKDATLRVTYQNLDNAGNPSDSWTISQEGATKVAYIQEDSKTVIDGDTVTTCDNLKTEPSCQTIPGGPDVAKSMLAGLGGGLFSAAAAGITSAAAAGDFGDKSTDTIAGRSADCVTITAGSALGKLGGAVAKALGGNTKAGYTACVDKDTGFLLKWQVVGVDDDKSGIIATDVGAPQASDFETPTTSTTSEGSGETSTTSESGGGSGSTTTSGGGGTCTSNTLPGGGTLPGGVTIPTFCTGG